MRFFLLLGQVLRDIWSQRHLAATLAIRDTKAKYRGAVLGLAWSVLPPIIAAVVLAAATGAGVLSLGETSIPYPAFVIFSMSLWQLFTAAVTRPIQALSAAKGLLTKVDFPREVIIVSEFQKLFVFACVQALVVAATFVYFGIKVSPLAFLIVIPALTMILLGFAMGMLLAPFALLHGDLNNALPMIMNGLFFMTPVVYVLPKEGGRFSAFVRSNPLTVLMEFSREVVIGTHASQHLGDFFLVLGLTILLLCVALVFFRIAMPVVIERWSA